MADPQRKAADEISERARGLPPEERDSYLASACGGDESLRQAVEARLAGTLAGSPTPSGGTTKPLPEGSSRPIRQIGSYRLLDLLGEGGMGEVWLAEQTEPVRRKVALKLIKQGMASKQVVARFEAERQALAMMDHPSIAKIHDAGASEDGRPYFVMEHVPGVAITAYCDRHRLDNQQRLALFTQVCEAVQHAHQKAVIHRDLKPSNILVTLVDGRPVPKIIDFGIAKATAQSLSDSTIHTQVGALIGTPAYASPEQARLTGEGIDTRTDVYALGVVLYELLTGALPFDPDELRRAGLEAMVRMICEEEPARPSTRLSEEGAGERAARRQTDLPALRRELSGDLDWITMKALAKDRTRRYGSPVELAADIERYRRNQPVLASPPSVLYLAQKFLRRHTAAVAAATLAVLALVAFGATMGLLRRQAETARSVAEQRASELELLTEFQASMLSGVDPSQIGIGLYADLVDRVRDALVSEGKSASDASSQAAAFERSLRRANATDVSLAVLDRHMLGPAVRTIDESFGDQPVVSAALQHTVAGTYLNVGLVEPAVVLQEEAHALRRRALGEDDPATLESATQLARVLDAAGQADRALELGESSLTRARRALGNEHPVTLALLDQVGTTARGVGNLDHAQVLTAEALEGRRRVLGEEAPETLSTLGEMGHVLVNMGRLEEALPYWSATLDGRRRVLGESHRETLSSLNNMGGLHQQMGAYEEALRYYQEALDGSRRVLGSDHPATLSAMGNVASVLQSMGRLEEALEVSREALDRRRRALGVLHPSTLTSVNNTASVLKAAGHLEDAREHYEEALSGFRKVLGEGHPATLRVTRNTALLYGQMGDAGAAVSLLIAAEPVARETYVGAIAHRMGAYLSDLGELQLAAGSFEAAERSLLEAHRIAAESDRDRTDLVRSLVALYESWNMARPGAGHESSASDWRGQLLRPDSN